MKSILLAIFVFYSFPSIGQNAFKFESNMDVQIQGRNLTMPFAGGINAAQMQQLDIKGDGREALVVWDRNAGNLLVFEKNEVGYQHNPELRYYFPDDITGFLILADFDQDGKKDLFTGSPFGIKVYKNTTATDADFPKWELFMDYLRLENNANLQLNLQDIPSIMDIDGDGDLDIVAFNFASGDYLEYFQNTSMERNGKPGLDGFASPVRRWGGFEFCGCGDFSFGQTCAGNPISQSRSEGENFRVEHAGGHSLLLHDFNGDGNLDLLMGQDECGNLFYLPNQGSNVIPVFNSFSQELPRLSPLPEFPVFHAAYILNQDLLVTSHSDHAASQIGSDFARNIYHYENGSTLTTEAFLQNDMVDLGENSRPFFKGNDLSGNLIVTANSLVEGEIVGKAFHFSLTAGNWTLLDNDYLNLSSLQLLDLQYQEFTPANQAPSLFISGMEIINFTPVRKLLWSSTLDGQRLREVSFPDIQLRGNDQLQFFNYQEETFLLLSRETGELVRYKVVFNPDPEFQLLDRNYLGFVDEPANRNLNVHVANGSDGLDLYTIDQNGILGLIKNFAQNSALDTLSVQLSDGRRVHTRFGRNTWISSLPATFGNTLDLVMGTKGGGLVYLKDMATDDTPPSQRDLLIKVYPNPSNGPLTIISNEDGLASIINALGQEISGEFSVQANNPFELRTQNLSSGVYFVKILSISGRWANQKFLIQK